MKSLEQVRKDLDRQGITMVDWAKKHGYSYQSVQRVLSGHAACKRGQTHDIAVLLGLKEREVIMK